MNTHTLREMSLPPGVRRDVFRTTRFPKGVEVGVSTQKLDFKYRKNFRNLPNYPTHMKNFNMI